jgi:hypothetical protein
MIAIKTLQLIANLSNRQNYEYTEEQAKKIVRALQQELDQVKHSFGSGEGAGRGDFKL